MLVRRFISKINFLCFQSGIVASLKEILRNRNYYQSKKEKERLQESSVVSSVVRDKQLEKNKKAIHEEMEKPSPSKSVLKGNLNECRMERQALAKKQSYGDHIKDFPCLKLPDLVSNHKIFNVLI